eukprot:12401980-Alexandrium_andersonii.AAC.1
MAKTTKGEASPPPQRPFRVRSRPPPDGRHTMGEDAFTQQLCAPRSGAHSCHVGALSPIARRPSGGGLERALK